MLLILKLPLSYFGQIKFVLFNLAHDFAIVPHFAEVAAAITFLLLLLCHGGFLVIAD